jgi:hypothetical protein
VALPRCTHEDLSMHLTGLLRSRAFIGFTIEDTGAVGAASRHHGARPHVG